MTTHARAFLLTAFLVATSVLAQTTPAPEQQQPTGTYQGSIVTIAGAPVSDARILLRGASQGNSQMQNTVSGLDGKFSFSQLDPGRYSVRITRPGFIMATEKALWNHMIEVKAGDVATDKLTLAPESVISGRVVNADGEPVEFANVQAMKISRFQGGRTTNERGEFRIYGLTPGRYVVRATPATSDMPPELRADGSREQQDIPTYFPSSTGLDGATRVEVAEGGNATGVEIRLARAPVVKVGGLLRGVEEKDYPNFYLMPAESSMSGQMLREPHRKDDTYTFMRLFPGRFKLFAAVYGDAGPKLSTTPIEIEVGDKDLNNVDLSFEPPVDLEGRIKWVDEEKGKAVNVRQIDLQQDGIQIGGTMFAQISDGNTFRMTKVPRDRYPVTIATDKGLGTVQSIEMGGVEMPDRILDLRHGAAGPVTIVLSTDAGDLSGKVENSKPFVVVVLVADRAAGRGRIHTSQLDADGAYQFKQIPPGEYRIVIVDERDVPEITSGDTLGFYEVDAKRVKVGANETITLDLKQP